MSSYVDEGVAPAASYSPNGHVPPTPPPVDRVRLAWRRKWWTLGLSVLLAVAAFVVANAQESRYSATATIQVSILQTEGIGNQNALAANELAAQYAQLADSQPVLDLARARLGASSGGLTGTISAAPVNDYNLIGVTVEAGSSRSSARQADAAAQALVQYLNTLRSSALDTASETQQDRITKLDQQIAALQKEITEKSVIAQGDGDAASQAAAILSGDRSLLASLTAARENLFTAPARSLAVAQPRLTLIDRPSSGSLQPKRAALYGGLGFVVGLILFTELFIVVAQLRSRVSSDSRSRRHKVEA